MTGPAELAAEAAELWGGGRLTPVAVSENAVFRLEAPDGVLALRLHRDGYQSRAGIAAELDWTAALAARGFQVPAPVATVAGVRVAEVDGRAFSAVSWLEGVPVGAKHLPLAGAASDQMDLFGAIGMLIGRLHELTDQLGLGAELPRPRWDGEGLVGETPRWGAFWLHPGFAGEDQALIGRVRAMARERLQDRALDFGLIHADVLRGNLLRTGGGLALIDFDDSGYGFRGYDLGTALVESLEEPHLPLCAEALLDGYRSARPDCGLVQRDLIFFTLLRALASSGWIVTRAAPDDPRQRLYAGRALGLAKKLVANSEAWLP